MNINNEVLLVWLHHLYSHHFSLRFSLATCIDHWLYRREVYKPVKESYERI